jgi:hypothetical protein
MTAQDRLTWLWLYKPIYRDWVFWVYLVAGAAWWLSGWPINSVELGLGVAFSPLVWAYSLVILVGCVRQFRLGAKEVRPRGQ